MIIDMQWLLPLLLAILATAAGASPQTDTPIDPTDPNSFDPSSLPTENFTLPEPQIPDPYPNGIPLLPDECDAQHLTEDCFQALGDVGKGAKLVFDKDHQCSEDKQFKLKKGFWEAMEMLNVAAKWSADGSGTEVTAAQYWFGPDYIQFFERLQGNIARESGMLNSKDSANLGLYITLSCADPQGICAQWEQPNEPGKRIVGYAWDLNGWTGVYGYINMCDPYFNTDEMHDLQNKLNSYKTIGDYEALQRMKNYITIGQLIIHEMAHLRSTYMQEPKIEDVHLDCGKPGDGTFRAYGPGRTYQLAHGEKTGELNCRGASFTSRNADNYAMFVNTLFWWPITGAFPGAREPKDPPGLTPEPEPTVLPHFTVPDDADFSVSSIGDQLRQYVDRYMAENDDDDDVEDEPAEPSKTEEPSQSTAPPTPTPEQNSCHGISGDYWIMSRDVAVDSVNQFCNQHDQTARYNQGTINELELSVKKVVDDGSGPQDSPDCAGRFVGAVIDGCDGGDEINNPYNYKFGGTFTSGDGWTYTMTPLSQNVNEVSCDIAYRFFDNYVEIRGKNVPFNNLGPWGQGLLDNMRGCGVVTDWKFEFTPDDCCFQWYAAGAVPALAGMSSCIGTALQSAGGSGPGNCKRQAIHSNAIDNWPGYGDEAKHVFGPDAHHEKRDNIDSWPGTGYGDEGKHVFRNKNPRW